MTQHTNAMLGLLIGDALGVPYQFHPPAALPQHIDVLAPSGFDRMHGELVRQRLAKVRGLEPVQVLLQKLHA